MYKEVEIDLSHLDEKLSDFQRHKLLSLQSTKSIHISKQYIDNDWDQT